jgi:ATP-dependent DNA helicase DinG
VLISPSLALGIDLKDDLSRFQIITKVPYPSLGDRYIREKFERDKQWYNLRTALRLIQAVGRSVRSKDDWAHTYVLDSNLGNFIVRNIDRGQPVRLSLCVSSFVLITIVVLI